VAAEYRRRRASEEGRGLVRNVVHSRESRLAARMPLAGIVSSGRTGMDRGALDAALVTGFRAGAGVRQTEPRQGREVGTLNRRRVESPGEQVDRQR
jgi:hypothetical protein